MFEWLDEEISRIRTRKFHLVDGPTSVISRQSIVPRDVPLPPSYQEFIGRFGNAALYRHGTFYYITITASPVEAITDSGERYLQFGRTWTSHAFFKGDLLSNGCESPVFEAFKDGFHKTAESFEVWLHAKAQSARRRFKKREWDTIIKGPLPFTENEKAIIEARKSFRWRVIGVSPNDDLRFEVHNGSLMTLPYLSIGIRGKLRPPQNGPLTGGVFLPVSSIAPGMTKTIEFDCYKKFISPSDTEPFHLPDPGPEDREEYWEFRKSPHCISGSSPESVGKKRV